MGKFLEGWESARQAHEAKEAEKRRRQEIMAGALKELSDALAVDGEELQTRNLTLRMEHGALVLKRLAEPLAGVNFDPDTRRFKIHKYTVTEGSAETDEAGNIEECALKLGAYAYSLKG